MIHRDGTQTVNGRVMLFDMRDLFVIEREEIRRIYIDGNKLTWLASRQEHEIEFSWDQSEFDARRDSRSRTCNVVVEIFDSIVFEQGNVTWYRKPDGFWLRAARRDAVMGYDVHKKILERAEKRP